MWRGARSWLADRLRWSRPSEADQDATRDEVQDPAPEPLSPARRAFLVKLSLAAGGLGATAVGIPVIGVLLSPLARRLPAAWHDVGAVEDFGLGQTVAVTLLDPEPLPWAGFAGQSAAWLRREGEHDFAAFSIYCTHTGCPLRWVEDAGLFLCPCHGGAFHRDGSVAAGPPPEPLPRLTVRVRDGRVELLGIPSPIPDQEGETEA